LKSRRCNLQIVRICATGYIYIIILSYRYISPGKVSSTGVTQFDWDFGDGNIQIGAFNTTHVYADTGVFIVQYVIANEDGCIDTTLHPITIRDSVNAFIEAVQSGCELTDLTIDLNVEIDVDEPINLVFWDFGDGNVMEGLIDPQHTYADTGTYNVTVTIGTITGCPATSELQVHVSLDTAFVDFEYDIPPCNDYNAIFTDMSVEVGQPIVGWSWDFGDGNSDTIQNPLYSYSGPGTYTVSLTIETTSGCTFTTQQELIFTEAVIELPDELEICRGDSVQLPLTTNFGELYIWFPEDGLNDNLTQQPIASPEETTIYTVTVRGEVDGGDTCSLVENVMVIVNEATAVDAIADQYIVEQGTVVQLDATDGFSEYSWSPEEEVSSADVQDPTSTIDEAITFEVTVVDQNGCVNSDTVTILVRDIEVCQLESLFVPNAFSPNGDGLNDFLNIQIDGEYDRFDFRINDRWGKLLFHTTDINVGWDGTTGGSLLSGDAFGYILEIECNGEITIRQGNITLIR